VKSAKPVLIELPIFKSSAARYIFAAFLTPLKSFIQVSGGCVSDRAFLIDDLPGDIRVMISIVKQLGADVDIQKEDQLNAYVLAIKGIDFKEFIIKKKSFPVTEINCIESAFAARIFMVLNLFIHKPLLIKTEKTLCKRPLLINSKLSAAAGLIKKILNEQDSNPEESAPDNINTCTFDNNRVIELENHDTSQYISGFLLIFSALGIKRNLTFIISNPVSRPYIRLTLQCIKAGGRECELIEKSNNKKSNNKKSNNAKSNKMVLNFKAAQGSDLSSFTAGYSPDMSGLGFILSAIVLHAFYSKQGSPENIIIAKTFPAEDRAAQYTPDSQILTIFGPEWFRAVRCGKPGVPGLLIKAGKIFQHPGLPPITLDCRDNPDLFLCLVPVSALIPVKAVFKNVDRLNIKESKRLDAALYVIKLLGAEYTLKPGESGFLKGSDLIISGRKCSLDKWIKPDDLKNSLPDQALKDHRFFMMLCVIASLSTYFFKKISLKISDNSDNSDNFGIFSLNYLRKLDNQCLKKSFPGFLNELEKIIQAFEKKPNIKS
jgi:5-enolpyruvylshikimate-3-phosphate synthase